MALIGIESTTGDAPVVMTSTAKIVMSTYPSLDAKLLVDEELYEFGAWNRGTDSVPGTVNWGVYDITSGLASAPIIGSGAKSFGAGPSMEILELKGSDVIRLDAGKTYAIACKVLSGGLSLYNIAFPGTENTFHTVATGASAWPDPWGEAGLNFPSARNFYAKTRIRAATRLEIREG